MAAKKRALEGREKELIQHWETEKDLKKIGRILGVSASTVNLELDRLGICERVTREKIESHFEEIKDTDEFFYILGILWAIGTVSGDKFLIRHRQREVIDEICRVLKYIPGPYQVQKRWTCHFKTNHPMYRYLESLGWSGRWNQSRSYPNGDINEDEFIRGYVSQHISIDTAKNKRRNQVYQRIRIFGAENILERINAFFAEKLGTTPKKLQKEGRSEVMRILYYTSKEEVPVIRRFWEYEKSPRTDVVRGLRSFAFIFLLFFVMHHNRHDRKHGADDGRERLGEFVLLLGGQSKDSREGQNDDGNSMKQNVFHIILSFFDRW